MERFELEKKMVEMETKLLENQKVVSTLNETIHEMYVILKDVLNETEHQKQINDQLQNYAFQLNVMLKNAKYEALDLETDESVFFPKFRSDEETIRLITEEGKSLARFGDGEFSIVFQINRQKFQKYNPELARRIRQVFEEENEQLLVAIAKNYGNLERYNDTAKLGIQLYMNKETRLLHRQILSLDKTYSDGYITRPYVIFNDCFTDGPKIRFERLKSIWTEKNIMVVEGSQTRLGVKNDLFAKAKSVKRVLAPPTNSFERYDDILNYCLKHADEVDLFILAIGPSSGVLAFDLSKSGYQAVDVGHIDLEYEWFLAGQGQRVSIPYKYNNEVTGGDQVIELHDEKYDSEIVISFAE